MAWYSRQLADHLFRAMDSEASLTDCLRRAIVEVRDLHDHECNLDAGSPSATVAAFRLRGEFLETMVLADASVVVATESARGSRVEVITDDRLSILVAKHRQGIISEPFPGWIEARRNRQDGFWCAQHLPEAADWAITRSFPLAEVRTIMAASDGVSRLWEMFDLTPAEVVQLARDPRALLDRLRALEIERSTDLIAAGQLKPHDDASLVRWESLSANAAHCPESILAGQTQP